MKHSFIDQYSDRDSFIHRLDPRTKFIATLVFTLAVLSTPPVRWPVFAAYLALILVLILSSRLPFSHILKRSLVIIPFVLLIAVFMPFFTQGEIVGSFNIWSWRVSVTYNGLLVLWNVLIKAWLSILALIWLTSTTRVPHLFKGLERLRMPSVMVMVLSFMYRYLFVLADEVLRMKQARDSRHFGGSRLWQMRTVGNMVGTLFIRSYERGERVYAAMLARGFDGQSRTLDCLRFRRADALFGVAFGLFLVSIGASALFY